MDTITAIALNFDWWVRYRANEPIQTALRKSLLAHWVPAVEKRLGELGMTWTSLADLRVTSMSFPVHQAASLQPAPSAQEETCEGLSELAR